MTLRQRRAFYQTPAWRAMSHHIRERDGYLCTACKPRTVAARLVHHVKPLSEGGAALDPANLTSLCADCHREAHNVVVDEGKREWTRYIEQLQDTFSTYG